MKRTGAVLLAAAVLAALPGTAAAWKAPGDIVVSPDGGHVYATGEYLLMYSRDPVTGRLTQIGQLPTAGAQLALSPDGAFAYVASENRIDVLSRDPSTGLLRPSSVVLGGVSYGVAFGGISDMAVAGDGRTLYVTQTREHALIALARDPATGVVSKGSVYFPNDERGRAYPTNSPRVVATPDDRDIYVVAQSVAHFRRDAAGKLVRVADLRASADNAVVAPDGRSVYVRDGDTRAVLVRDSHGSGDWLTGASTNAPDEGCAGCPLWPIALLGESGFVSGHSSAGVVQAIQVRDGQPMLDGSLGSIPDLPAIAEVAASPDARHIYATGGVRQPVFPNPLGRGAIATIRTGAPGLKLVQTIVPDTPEQVHHPYPGVSIADGAIYVNSRDVTLTVNRPTWNPTEFEVSNDGSFAQAQRVTVQPGDRYSWRLAAGATPERMVKRVYLRFVPNGHSDWDYSASSVATDDVILDTRAPELSSAKVRGRRLVLRARDDRSGVKQLQVTTNKKKPGAPRKFMSRLGAPRGRKAVYVRVIDGAGNRSGWRQAKR